jgi:hypothetical protein
MADTKGLDVDRRVGIAMDALAPSERRAVGRVLASPKLFERIAAAPGKVRKIKASEQLYTLEVTPSLRLVFRETPEGTEVLDLIGREALNRLTSRRPAETDRGKAKAVEGRVHEPAGNGAPADRRAPG